MSLKTIVVALGFVVLAWASLGLTEDSPLCKADTAEGREAHRALREYLLLHGYPERLVRQIDVIPRCPYCMTHPRGFVIEAVYSPSGQPEPPQAWSPAEEVRHLRLVKEGVIEKFRIRYEGDDCSCCDRPAHSAAAWIDKTSLYDPPQELTALPPPPSPPDIARSPYPPTWRQAHASCPACASDAEARNAVAQRLYDLQVRRVDAVFELRTASVEAHDWSEYYGRVDNIPEAPSNSAARARALRDASRRMTGARERERRLDDEQSSIQAEIDTLTPQLAAADAALADCEGEECRLASTPSTAPPTGLNAAVLDEINFARAHPAEYALRLRDYRASHPAQSAADAADIDSAIAYVERQRPMAGLASSAPLTQAAAWLAADQGAIGGSAHVGTDGSTMTQRMHAAGVWAGAATENIALGPPDAGAMVLALVVDRGVRGYGHRTTIFDPSLQIAGVGCALHALYGYICVIDYAGEVVARE
jgi:uncharacterized protein YkwD